jgi:hypothetical protein
LLPVGVYEAGFDDIVKWNTCPQTKFESNGLRITLIGEEQYQAGRCDDAGPECTPPPDKSANGLDHAVSFPLLEMSGHD